MPGILIFLHTSNLSKFSMTHASIFLNCLSIILIALVCSLFASLVDIHCSFKRPLPLVSEPVFKRFSRMFSIFLIIALINLGCVFYLKTL